MRIAGLGFRAAATTEALHAALTAAGGNVTALATASDKAGAPALATLAARLNLPILSIPPEVLAAQPVQTHSPRVQARYNTGSLAEAAALAAAGPGARLTGPRSASPDGMATAAIAERSDG